MVSFFIFAFSQNQGINNIWLTGYNGGLGETKIDFYSGIPVINQYNVPMDFRHTFADICDSSGNMLFYTNGYYIADATNDTIQNGSGINLGAYANFAPDGFAIPQAALIIQKPDSNNIYYMFHSTVDDSTFTTALCLYVTTIDMSLQGGLGAVISKNQIIINDSLNAGKITACRHANGRDWWVVVHRVNSNKYYFLLVTPNGIIGPTSQNIGTSRGWDVGQEKFSPDGSMFAYYHYFDGLDIYKFNRCTGIFSNPVFDYSLPYIQGNVGCEFSPNSQILYVSNILQIYQYDLTVANIISSRTTVAVWDSFYQPGIPNLGAYLCLPQLAPDGKIYITTGNGTTYYGTIDNPDSLGMACNVAQHSVLLPTYYFNTLPNHSNYFLHCDTSITGGCPCVLSNVADSSPQYEKSIVAMPNPTNGKFTLQFDVQSISGVVEVYNTYGKLVMSDYVAPWCQYKHVDISQMPSGIYLCRMKWKNNITGNVKVVKE
jgi:hypothetical protein